MTGEMLRRNILLTGPPGCGKSTLIEKIVRGIDRPATGFFTREMREHGRRVGFSITTLDGKSGILAHVEVSSRQRVGRYGVNLRDLEEIAVPSIMPQNDTVVVVTDEIGKMECLSSVFRQALIATLDLPNTLIGTISLKGNAFIDSVKKRQDVILLAVTERNWNGLIGEVLELIR